MLTSGDGTTRFVLSRLVPETKFESTTTMVVSNHGQGEPADRRAAPHDDDHEGPGSSSQETSVDGEPDLVTVKASARRS